jgi:hypothetical protein
MVLAERFDRRQPGRWIVVGEVAMQWLMPFAIDDAGVHRIGVQVDAALEFVLSVVELHRGLL